LGRNDAQWCHAYSQNIRQTYLKLLRKDWELVFKRLAEEMSESSCYSSSDFYCFDGQNCSGHGFCCCYQGKARGGTHSTPL